MNQIFDPKEKLKELLSAGVHFGHLTRRWNPKMRPFIFMEKNGIHVIDLKKTVERLEVVCREIAKIVASGEKILFVGTKRQAQDIVRQEAERSGMYYVVNRWLGGMLTNFSTIRKSIARLKEIEEKTASEDAAKLTKCETKFMEKCAKAETKGDCSNPGNCAALELAVDNSVDSLSALATLSPICTENGDDPQCPFNDPCGDGTCAISGDSCLNSSGCDPGEECCCHGICF